MRQTQKASRQGKRGLGSRIAPKDKDTAAFDAQCQSAASLQDADGKFRAPSHAILVTFVPSSQLRASTPGFPVLRTTVDRAEDETKDDPQGAQSNDPSDVHGQHGEEGCED